MESRGEQELWAGERFSGCSFVNKLAGLCGEATNYKVPSHPSLPNYIALTSGYPSAGRLPSRRAAPPGDPMPTPLRIGCQFIRCHRFLAVNAFDALVFPLAPIPPPPQGGHATVGDSRAQVPVVDAMGTIPSVGSVGGLASLVRPGGRTRSGPPIGLEFAAAAGSDRASAVDRADSRVHPRPGSCAAAPSLLA
jgi:Amidase